MRLRQDNLPLLMYKVILSQAMQNVLRLVAPDGAITVSCLLLAVVERTDDAQPLYPLILPCGALYLLLLHPRPEYVLALPEVLQL